MLREFIITNLTTRVILSNISIFLYCYIHTITNVNTILLPCLVILTLTFAITNTYKNIGINKRLFRAHLEPNDQIRIHKFYLLQMLMQMFRLLYPIQLVSFQAEIQQLTIARLNRVPIH